jgi:Ni,Fe-hydrogenase I large subunit
MGQGDVRYPGIVVDGELVTTNLVDINLGIRILLGSSYYEDWGENGEVFVKNDPLGNPVDRRHPWNQTTIPKPQKRDFGGNYTWVMSPRWLDKRTGDHLALDTGGGPIARLWATALAGLVDIGYVKAPGRQNGAHSFAEDGDKTGSRIYLAHSEVEQRNRTRSCSHLFPGVCRGLRLLFL